LAAAALDLGGGSTQVTFIPFDDNKAFAEVDKPKFSHQLSIFGNPIELYTHSYLGNGLVAARLGIIQGSSAKLNGRSLMSYCLPADFTINNWDYAGNLWNVTGSSVASFTACLRSAIKYINETDVRRVPELNEHDLYVFSYFYDRGVQGGLIPHTLDNSGGRSTVSSYKEAAIHGKSKAVYGIINSKLAHRNGRLRFV
uniref:Ectonucleoside triphosphate diphosphohydrolase 5 n=1 Tax=Toxocara canis TaxID=6265 RepID=A0A183U703_TOXCA